MARTIQVDPNEPVDDDGLTETERMYLTTPFSQLDEQQRMTAMAIKDKQSRNRAIANEAYRAKLNATRIKLK